MRKKNENFRQVMPQKKCRNILELSVFKALLTNKKAVFKLLGLPKKAFSDPKYYDRFIANDGDVISSLIFDESLETYDSRQLKSAINRMRIKYLQDKKNRIASSNKADKAQKIRKITLKIEKLNKRVF